MSFTIKIKPSQFNLIDKKLGELQEGNIVTRQGAKEVGDKIISEMKNMIKGGVSPIAGEGRFPAYKNPDRYPAKLKPKRPVNLKLTGDFLASLQNLNPERYRFGYKTIVGFTDSSSKKKEKGHREGAMGQPKRPIIPSFWEEFAQRIQVEIIKIYKGIVKRFTQS